MAEPLLLGTLAAILTAWLRESFLGW